MTRTQTDHLKLDFIVRNLAYKLSITTALIGFVVLLGWIFNLPFLKSVLPGLVTMKVNTALSFFLSGMSLWLWDQNHPQKKSYLQLISQILAVIVAIIGLLTLIQYGFHVNLGIDQLLIKEEENAIATSYAGRMAPNTALCFFWLGLALILAWYRLTSIAQSLAFASFLIAVLGLVGYVFKISSFYHLESFTGMALHTSIAFILLSSGILLASSQHGWMQEVMSPYLGGIIARNLLPLVIAIPILTSGLFLSAYRSDFIPMELGFVLRVIINILVLGGVVWWTSRYLNNIDKKYQNLQQALQEYNDNLEAKVYERTHQLECANQALIESRHQLSNLINTLPGIVFSRSFNHNWSIDSVSDGYFFIIGECKKELCQSEQKCSLQNLIVREDLPKIVAAIQTAINNKTAYEVEYRIHTSCGHKKWLWEKGIETSIDGNSQTIQGFITEITSLKETEEALRESEAKFREIAENIREVFHINSADLSELIYISPGYEIIWGKSCESVYQKPESWGESMHPDDRDRLFAACERLIQGKPLEEEYRIIRPDGDIRWISARVFPVYSQSGQILRHVGIAADITNRKQAELEIRQLNEELEERVQQRTAQLTAINKELEAFSYSVSHDLRAPLRGIDGFSRTLLERYTDQLDDRGQHYLTRIRAGTQRMGELIDDLLQLSRVTRSQMQLTHVNLSAIAQEIAEQLNESEPVRQVEWLISPDLIVQGDYQLLRIVMENLLNNAWKFTSKKTQATIELTSLNSESKESDYLTYIIRDNGVGFDQTYANKLFQAFQRLHSVEEFPGTGIGLATVQRIINRHGGDVWASAVVDEGATFYFTLQS
ncbi:PAS domain-containing protein [Anabaena sp. UHCC 0451]|uniref:PAS domain-containing sensor histidine kinase n=1 Tax=Anabaena sp. UHCC 0451 TaxID=2055235 RepID=UPI002B20DF71|nr:PAS domain-containing protein [Anabaena sp. UHCC 0451]MEA5576483.1 PAS domain-containing protein [Anabaena sp. UHCC 0451]